MHGFEISVELEVCFQYSVEVSRLEVDGGIRISDRLVATTLCFKLR